MKRVNQLKNINISLTRKRKKKENNLIIKGSGKRNDEINEKKKKIVKVKKEIEDILNLINETRQERMRHQGRNRIIYNSKNLQGKKLKKQLLYYSNIYIRM